MSTPDQPACPTCGGDTIRFRGVGLAIEQWVCPSFREPGHLPDAEMRAKRTEYIKTYGPRESDGSPKVRFA